MDEATRTAITDIQGRLHMLQRQVDENAAVLAATEKAAKAALAFWVDVIAKGANLPAGLPLNINIRQADPRTVDIKFER